MDRRRLVPLQLTLIVLLLVNAVVLYAADWPRR